MTAESQLTFRALADPTRRDILGILAQGDRTIAEVAERFDMTRPAIRKHLSVLEEGQLVTVQERGRERVTRLNPDGFRPVVTWLTHFDVFWDDRLSALQSAIAKEASE